MKPGSSPEFFGQDIAMLRLHHTRPLKFIRFVIVKGKFWTKTVSSVCVESYIVEEKVFYVSGCCSSCIGCWILILHWLLNPYTTALVVESLCHCIGCWILVLHCGVLVGVPMGCGVGGPGSVLGGCGPWAICGYPLDSGPELPYIPKAKVTAMVMGFCNEYNQ